MNKNPATEESLLEAFVDTVEELRIPNAQLRSTLIPGKSELGRSIGKRAELRLEARHEKTNLRVFPQLHPSRKLLARRPGPSEPPYLVVSPHIPDDLATDYQEAGINHADLNGRLFIQTPYILIDRAPRTIRYQNPVSEPDLFSPKASRVVRAFLSHRDRSWTQAELTDRTRISRGLVSRLLKELREQCYVISEAKSGQPGPTTYRLAEFDRLLDSWKTEDTWSKRGSVRQYSLLTNDAGDIARTVRDALGSENAAFTQWFAAHIRHPYTTPPIVSAYVRKERPLPEFKFAREVRSGGNLWLIAPEDEGLFFETQDQAGFQLVSDVQIYLDLLQMGQRGPDAAEALRAWDGFAR